ncbi:MAG: hypothetical protein M1541_21355 [Acidobacteria bacterium]|nr:hypothetical protein [Acidobacteriota bacterium]
MYFDAEYGQSAPLHLVHAILLYGTERTIRLATGVRVAGHQFEKAGADRVVIAGVDGKHSAAGFRLNLGM